MRSSLASPSASLRSGLVVVVVAGVVGACGGSAPEPKAPPPDSASASSGKSTPTAVSPAQKSAPGPAGSLELAPSSEGDPMWDAFERDRLQLDASNDCPSACRALASMDRSAGRVCTLSGRATSTHCEDAKSAVRSARTRVHEKCRTCPGVSTDASDPVPATPQ